MSHEVTEAETTVEETGAKSSKSPEPIDGIRRERKWYFSILTILWVVGAFFLSSLIVMVIIALLPGIGIDTKSIDTNVFLTVASAAIYVVLVALTLGAPRALRLWSSRIKYSKLLGLTGLVRWRDILFAILGFVVYLALGVGVILAVSALVPGFNAEQAQDLGFSKTLSANNAVLVFLALVVVAPVAEEIIFRGYLFGTLRRSVPVWVAALLTSIVFGAVHGQWNVGVDVFVMSLVSCFLRYKTGSLYASMLLHMFKNGLAFYTLYIATSSIM